MTNPIKLKIRRVLPGAEMPAHATAGAAAFDLKCVIAGEPVEVAPGTAHAFDTGLAFEIPPGHVMLVYSRSGHGFKSGVRLSNSTGVIDSDFRDTVKVRLHNDGGKPFVVANGDRIAQAMVLPVPALEMVEVEALSETERGLGGLGSTGR